MTVYNAALHDWPVGPPETLEPAELARALGVAVALGRALILPFHRCWGPLRADSPPVSQHPWDSDHAKSFPSVWPKTSAEVPLSRFCFPFDGGPARQSTMVQKHYTVPEGGKLEWQPQQVGWSSLLMRVCTLGLVGLTVHPTAFTKTATRSSAVDLARCL